MSAPSQIVLLRHAEKPEDVGDPNLSPRGELRATALAVAIPERFGRPDQIFASAASTHSNRSVETVTPLSAALHVQIRAKWKDEEYATLAAHILGGKYDGEDLVVAWHHETLPALAIALGVKPPSAHWSSAVFDRFWRITYTESGAGVVVDEPQNLLAGDSAT